MSPTFPVPHALLQVLGFCVDEEGVSHQDLDCDRCSGQGSICKFSRIDIVRQSSGGGMIPGACLLCQSPAVKRKCTAREKWAKVHLFAVIGEDSLVKLIPGHRLSPDNFALFVPIAVWDVRQSHTRKVAAIRSLHGRRKPRMEEVEDGVSQTGSDEVVREEKMTINIWRLLDIVDGINKSGNAGGEDHVIADSVQAELIRWREERRHVRERRASVEVSVDEQDIEADWRRLAAKALGSTSSFNALEAQELETPRSRSSSIQEIASPIYNHEDMDFGSPDMGLGYSPLFSTDPFEPLQYPESPTPSRQLPSSLSISQRHDQQSGSRSARTSLHPIQDLHSTSSSTMDDARSTDQPSYSIAEPSMSATGNTQNHAKKIYEALATEIQEEVLQFRHARQLAGESMPTPGSKRHLLEKDDISLMVRIDWAKDILFKLFAATDSLRLEGKARITDNPGIEVAMGDLTV